MNDDGTNLFSMGRNSALQGTLSPCVFRGYGQSRRNYDRSRHGHESFSGKALEFCFREGGYVCFEEDCAATVALRELMDRGLYQAPVNEHWKPGEYSAVIDSSIQRWYPDYWAAREAGQTHQTAAQEKRAKERER